MIRQFPLDYNHDFDAYVSITRHPYFYEGGDHNYQTIVDLPGFFSEVVFCGYLEINSGSDYRECDADQNVLKHANARLRTFKNFN